MIQPSNNRSGLGQPTILLNCFLLLAIARRRQRKNYRQHKINDKTKLTTTQNTERRLIHLQAPSNVSKHSVKMDAALTTHDTAEATTCQRSNSPKRRLAKVHSGTPSRPGRFVRIVLPLATPKRAPSRSKSKDNRKMSCVGATQEPLMLVASVAR